MKAFFNTFRIGIITILFFYSYSFSVNGIAVSVKGLSYTTENLSGSINRIDIENSKVVKDTIIYSSELGFARQVCISQDGKYVCFFRDGDKWINKEIVKGTPDYISVIEINGSNLKNIVEFTGTLAVNRYEYTQGGPDRYIDWPSGDWIYFQKPTTTEIWRVNFKTSAQEKIIDYPNLSNVPFINRFSLNSSGTRVSQFSNYCKFPSMTECASGQGWGCNHTMSASGRFVNGWLIWVGNDLWPAQYRMVGQGGNPGLYDQPYQGRQLIPGGHTYFEFIDWNWTTNKRTSFGIYVNDYFNYRHLSYILGTDYLVKTINEPMVGGAKSEFPRWACNSDKWIIHCPGQQQLLWNWVDREAILGGRNKYGQFGANDAGDFWVRPPNPSYIGTHYEDITGTWLPNGTQSTAPLPDYIRCPDLTNPHECALKYGSLEIMPQIVYDSIVAGHPPTFDDGVFAKAWAVKIPDISYINAKPGSSIQLTVTNQYYDPIDPIFGKPAPAPVWKIIGQGATISSNGAKATLATTSGFSKCSVEVSLTVGQTTKSSRKLVSSTVISVKPSSKIFTKDYQNKIRTVNGNVAITLSGSYNKVSVLTIKGETIYSMTTNLPELLISTKQFTNGIYVFKIVNSNNEKSFLTRIHD